MPGQESSSSEWWTAPFFQYTVGTAPAFADLLAPLPHGGAGFDISVACLDFIFNSCLRSVGQVVFCNNPWSGLLIIVAMIVDFEYSVGPLLCGSFHSLSFTFKPRALTPSEPLPFHQTRSRSFAQTVSLLCSSPT